jgi:serine phosphatase RsbU (regulator of sigma subunit)
VALLVADGLGHGPLAARAAEGAGGVFDADPHRDPRAIVEAIHRGIGGTRGAAIAVARVDPANRRLRYAAVGNIAGTLLHAGATRGLFSHNGTVGHQVRKVQEFEYPWEAGSVVVLYSDGLQSRWSADAYPGLLARHPAVVAGVLLRDFRRGRDDVTVMVVGSSRQANP